MGKLRHLNVALSVAWESIDRWRRLLWGMGGDGDSIRLGRETWTRFISAWKMFESGSFCLMVRRIRSRWPQGRTNQKQNHGDGRTKGRTYEGLLPCFRNRYRLLLMLLAYLFLELLNYKEERRHCILKTNNFGCTLLWKQFLGAGKKLFLEADGIQILFAEAGYILTSLWKNWNFHTNHFFSDNQDFHVL